jgi:putative transposase
MADFQTRKHHRNSIRLREYDYASHGAYFVTICTALKQDLFGEIIDGEMQLNPFGEIVESCWLEIPKHFLHAKLDEFVIMPNHIHFIVWLESNLVPVGAQHAAPLHDRTAHGDRPNVAPGSLGALVRSFKSAVTKRINESRATPGVPVWQRNYYERVVRANELENTRTYILENPIKWDLDEYRVTERIS